LSATEPKAQERPVDPNLIIIGKKEPDIYVSTLMQQALRGNREITVITRGYNNKGKLLVVLDKAIDSLPVKQALVTIQEAARFEGQKAAHLYEYKLVLTLDYLGAQV